MKTFRFIITEDELNARPLGTNEENWVFVKVAEKASQYGLQGYKVVNVWEEENPQDEFVLWTLRDGSRSFVFHVVK